eukprot:889932_1
MVIESNQHFWLFYPSWYGSNCMRKHGALFDTLFAHYQKFSFVELAPIGYPEGVLKIKYHFHGLWMDKDYYFILYPCTKKHEWKVEPEYKKNKKNKISYWKHITSYQ